MSRLATSLATAATLSFAAATSHAADIEVSVPASITRNVVENQMTDYMVDEPETRLSWRPGVDQPVHLSGTGTDVLHVVLDLSHEETILGGWLIDFPMSVVFDIWFRCDGDGVGLRVINPVVSVIKSSGAELLSPEQTEDMRADAQSMLDTKTRPMLSDVWKKLKSVENSNVPGFRQVCPHFEVSSSGKITAEVDFENGCINGRVKRRTCPPSWEGTGNITARCSNGEWHPVTSPGCYPPDGQPDHPTPPGHDPL
jgi:hypothetical protein